MRKAHPVLGVPMNPKEYAEEWRKNSLHFDEAGHYDWMKEQLGSANLVLEIGCGSGEGTHKLAKSGKKVVSIEINENMIEIAVENLRSKGITVEVRKMEALSRDFNNDGPQVIIVHANILDESLDTITPQGMFDAVVCWLIGAAPSHISDQMGTSFEEFTGEEMAIYRTTIHSRCYELGKSVLKLGGQLQITDRIGISSWNDKGEIRELIVKRHSDLAGTSYTLAIENTLLRKAGNFITSNIQYIGNESSNGRVGCPVISSSKAVLLN